MTVTSTKILNYNNTVKKEIILEMKEELNLYTEKAYHCETKVDAQVSKPRCCCIFMYVFI